MSSPHTAGATEPWSLVGPCLQESLREAPPAQRGESLAVVDGTQHLPLLHNRGERPRQHADVVSIVLRTRGEPGEVLSGGTCPGTAAGQRHDRLQPILMIEHSCAEFVGEALLRWLV